MYLSAFIKASMFGKIGMGQVQNDHLCIRYEQNPFVILLLNLLLNSGYPFSRSKKSNAKVSILLIFFVSSLPLSTTQKLYDQHEYSTQQTPALLLEIFFSWFGTACEPNLQYGLQNTNVCNKVSLDAFTVTFIWPPMCRLLH